MWVFVIASNGKYIYNFRGLNLMNNVTIIDKERILTNQDLAEKESRVRDVFFNLDVEPSKYTLKITSGQMIIIDPIYLADFYNEDDLIERYLKDNGVVLFDFGGDTAGPVHRTMCGGLKIILADSMKDDYGNVIFPEEFRDEVIASYIDSENLMCDSGSYIFLDYNEEFKSTFKERLDKNRRYMELFTVDMPNGYYNIAYEQMDADDENIADTFLRNIVVWPL